MFQDKLFQVIRQCKEIIQERSKMEDESDSSIPELFDADDEYAGLCVQANDLQDEIDAMIIDSKYTLLLGLDVNQMKELDFFIQSSDLSFNQNIEKHLDFRLLELRQGIKKRLNEIKPLRLTVCLDTRISILYNEVIRCYVYGSFNAACALCRAIAEVLIGGKDKVKGLKGERYTIYKSIKDEANAVLHKSSAKAEETHALASIKLLQSFIKKYLKQE